MEVIYGREEAKYKLNITSLISNTINNDSTDWSINDKNLDNSDNTTTLNHINLLVEPTKIYESKGIKNISTNIEFDDGWGNVYNHETSLSVDVQTYKDPILDFMWAPIEPTILDVVSFSQSHNNNRNDLSAEYYGRIDKVKIDFYNDDIFDIGYILKNDIFQKQFTTKQDNIPIRLQTDYWDGFEYKNSQIIKYLNMANIPPVSDWQRVDKGVCVPSFDWLATSIDLDDDISELQYEWKLYQNVYDVWNLVDSFNEKKYSYPFQFEGQYKIVLKTTDSEGSSDIKEETFDVLFKECNGATPGALKGTLRLQFGGFQLVALPVSKKVSDLVDLIADRTGLTDVDVVKVCNAAPGIGNVVGNMYNYVPGVSNKLSSNNFDLIMQDTDVKEITAFWIQMLDHPTLSYIDIEWDSSTGELK